ncbi:hypothetical protein BU16DRAFT_7196 [Lophium mytilinum]|uniref:Uncharacterized protein n=1 Tax=Lophium mytilinum TaxID=390894 RepID=A0A6A6RC71_9PEZI|nr:hypothetical protein BU16DRAFT_7196 [Lophium mytilinum]
METETRHGHSHFLSDQPRRCENPTRFLPALDVSLLLCIQSLSNDIEGQFQLPSLLMSLLRDPPCDLLQLLAAICIAFFRFSIILPSFPMSFPAHDTFLCRPCYYTSTLHLGNTRSHCRRASRRLVITVASFVGGVIFSGTGVRQPIHG